MFLAILKEEISYTNASEKSVIIPADTTIQVEILNGEEIIGTYNDESFELDKDEFAVLH